MDQLLSGLIGALVATLFSVMYLYLSDSRRVRMELLLEVVGYCDDIYNRLQFLQSQKDGSLDDSWNFLSSEQYSQISRELTVLLTSSQRHAKLAVLFGEGELLGKFNELQKSFISVASTIYTSMLADWEENSAAIHVLFKEKIDPLRSELEGALTIAATPPWSRIYHKVTGGRVA